MKPTVGRIVHYHDHSNEPLAAIITKVWSDTMVNLAVFSEGGTTYSRTSVNNESQYGTFWCWPDPKANEAT